MAKKAMSKPVLMGSAIALSLIIIISATYAWFTAQETKENKFKTGALDGKVSIYERFVPPDDWTPGQEVIKNVGAVNTGTTPALVRISFEEFLKKLSKKDYDKLNKTERDTAIAEKREPVYVSITQFTETGTEWEKLPEGAIPGAQKLPTGVDVYYLMSKTTNAKGKEVRHYSFFSVYKQTVGTETKYVRVDLHDDAIKIIPGDTSDTFVIDDTEGMFLYCYYAKYQDDHNMLWYDPAKADALVDGKHTGNYPAAWPKVDSEKIKWSQTDVDDSNALLETILLGYSTDLLAVTTDLTTIADDEVSKTTGSLKDKWYFNKADGYFYYLGVLQPDTTTKLLLETVKLLEKAGNEYQLMDFNLTVKLDAIATSRAAVLAQWNNAKDDGTGPLGSNTDGSKSLLMKLYELCDLD